MGLTESKNITAQSAASVWGDVTATNKEDRGQSSCTTDSEIQKGTLNRIDNETWAYTVGEGVDSSFEEIRIHVPKVDKGKDAYLIAKKVALLFDKKIERLRESVLKTGLNLSIEEEGSSLSGTWHIAIPTPQGIAQRSLAVIIDAVKSAVPFFRPLNGRKIVEVTAEQLPSAAKVSRVALPLLTQNKPHLIGGGDHDVIPEHLRDRLLSESFDDPFTRLSTECFQKYERFFVMEAEHRGSYRFILGDDGKIRLEENDPSKSGYEDENRATVTAYAEFLKYEYGAAFVSQLEESYNISLSKMVAEGLPLLPDIVSKCNIGVNSIEISHIEHLHQQLCEFYKELRFLSLQPSWEHEKEGAAVDFLSHIPFGTEESLFSVREARGLLRVLPGNPPSIADLFDYLKQLGCDRKGSVRDRPAPIFNTLVSMIMPSEKELDRAFTGRKIRHTSVMGFHTMGDPNIPNPCRDMFELLHVFADCRKANDWENYYELLAHVVSKKSLFRKTPHTANSWHLGLLLPAPDSEAGEARWYCNDGFYDGHNGDVHYVLLPACREDRDDKGRLLPMIKLYRSTCSNSNAVNWQDSVAADLQPWGSPGSLDPTASSQYLEGYIKERSIPLWMGYLESARKEKGDGIVDWSTYNNRLMMAGREFQSYLLKRSPEAKEAAEAITRMIEVGDWDALEESLTKYGHYFKEDPVYKIPQDVAFVGHSLGGALAQHGTWFNFAGNGRIALPGNTVTCYSSDGPGIDNYAEANFTKFGHDHRELLSDLDIKTHVIHRFEYGDFVPQSGGSHLGSTFVEEDKNQSWLNFSASVFRPLATARAKDIITPGSAHARRKGLATEGRDFTLTELTPQKLKEFDHALWLRSELQRAFGFKVLRSPEAAEAIRRTLGIGLRPFLKIYQWLNGNQLGARDGWGVFAIDDGHA